MGVAIHCHLVDDRSARVAKAEVTGNLVVGLASCVVECLAEQAILAMPFHEDQHRVATRYEQNDNGQLEIWLFDERRVQVRFEMVDRNERLVPNKRQSLSRANTDEQRANQAWANRARNSGEIFGLDASLDHRLSNNRSHHLDVGAASHFGNHAAVASVNVDLARHDVGKNLVSIGNHSRGRLIARRLDSEDQFTHDGDSTCPNFEELWAKLARHSSKFALELGAPHDYGVFAGVAVVPGTNASPCHAAAFVEGNGLDVTYTNFEGEGTASASACCAEDLVEQQSADALASLILVYSDSGYVGISGQDRYSGVADHSVICNGDEVHSSLERDLLNRQLF